MSNLDKNKDMDKLIRNKKNYSPVCYMESTDIRPEFRPEKENEDKETTQEAPEN